MSARRPTPPILVLGATSLIGDFLTRRLTEAGADFVELSRREARLDRRWVRADLSDPDLAEKLPGLETVYSLSPIWLLPDCLPALHAAGMKRLIAFSSTSRFTKAASPEASERAVAQRLADAEAEVEEFCELNSVAWTILRPTMIYAEGRDANVTRLAGIIARFGVMPISGKGEGLRQPVHADDLAAGAIAAAGAKAAVGRAYDLPGGETLSYHELAHRLFEAQHKRPLILRLPPWLWRLAFALARPLLPGATAAMGQRMGEDLTFDGADAKRDFGWAPRAFRPQF